MHRGNAGAVHCAPLNAPYRLLGYPLLVGVTPQSQVLPPDTVQLDPERGGLFEFQVGGVAGGLGGARYSD